MTSSRMLALAAVAMLAAAPAAMAAKPKLLDILTVGNNWDGTADLIDVHTYQRVLHLNIVPDLDQRKAEIAMDPAAQGYFVAIRELIGEGHDQFVDDSFTSPDGRFLYVSRPSLADVVAFSLKTRKIVWRTKVEGYRSDHMAISKDGRRLLVSASTAAKVHQIDTRTGKITGSFESGETPHENNFSKDGTRIFHASIGKVYTPTDDPSQDATKGDRRFEIVDAKTLKVLQKINMGDKLAEAGHPNMSAAVRPMALSPDEHFLYFQVSFFHGFVEYDLRTNKVTRLAQLPESETAKGLRRDQYVLDSAHHGLSMDPTGKKLCVAGTMDDYAAIVNRKTFKYKLIQVGDKPYWSTNSADGKLCYVSVSGDDSVSVISYRTAKQVARIAVGDHPQRMRTGKLRAAFAE
jgi:YVTN family beta-propeller protein